MACSFDNPSSNGFEGAFGNSSTVLEKYFKSMTYFSLRIIQNLLFNRQPLKSLNSDISLRYCTHLDT